MTTARQFYEPQSNLAVVPPQKDWPTMYDLPSEYPEEEGLPDEFHSLQPQLLSATLRLPNVARDQIFTGSDLNLYYDRENKYWHKRPDWFAVAGVPRFYDGTDLRMSYVVWDEQVVPFVIVELLSPKTAKSDLGETQREPDGTPTKWEVYEQILKVPNYVVFDRYENLLRVYKLVDGQYQAQDVQDDRVWLEERAIGLGVWQGEFQGNTRLWLRWYDADDQWIPTEAEAERQQRDEAEQFAEQERSRAEQERSRAEQERSRRQDAEQLVAQERQQRQEAETKAKRLVEKLKALGIDADDL